MQGSISPTRVCMSKVSTCFLLFSKAQRNTTRHIQSEVQAHRLEGDTRNFTIYQTMQARARMQAGKAVDNNSIVIKVFELLFFEASAHINDIFLQGKQRHPTNWKITEYNALPTETTTTAHEQYRWIAKMTFTRQWYNRAWISHLRHDRTATDKTVRKTRPRRHPRFYQ